MAGALLILAIVSAVICSAAGAQLADHREGGFYGGVLGFFFGPFGVIAAGFVDARPRCPACRERVGSMAILCPHCRTALEWSTDKWGRNIAHIHPDAPLASQLRSRGLMK
jgi:hypothetical protein